MGYLTHSIRGAYSTYDATNTVLNDGGIFRIRDVEPDIPFTRPMSAMLYKFMSSVPHGRVATQEKVYISEQQITPNFVTVNATTASDAVSITVTDAYSCVPGDRLRNMRTFEIIRLDAVDSATVISVAAVTGYGRGFAGSTAAAMRRGDRLYKMGNALTSRGRTPQSSSKVPVEYYNYCSYFIKSVEAERQYENSVMLGNFGKMTDLMAERMFDFRREMNLDMWFGRRALDVVSAAAAHDSGGGNLYQMNGFDEQVTTHVWDLSSVTQVTWELLNEMFGPVFTNDAGDRLVFVGQNANSVLWNCARSNVVPNTYESIIKGVNVTAMKVDGGTIHVVPDYDGLPPGSMRVVHPKFCEWRAREGYDEQWIMNTILPTQVQEKCHTLLAGGTLIVKNEECHAKVDGIGGPFSRGLIGEVTS